MRNPLRRTAGLIVLLAAMSVTADTALAGTYHVYSCRTPAGGTAPTDGWSSSLSTTLSRMRNTCDAGGEMAVELAGAVPLGTVAGWRFTAPDNVSIGRVRLWRSGGAVGMYQSGGLPYWLISRPGTVHAAGSTIEVCGQDPSVGSCVSRGDGFRAMSDQNVVDFDAAGAPTFWATVQCGGVGPCDGTAPLPDAFLNVHAADVQLRDDAAPRTDGPVAGDLLVDGAVSGTRTVTAPLADVGSGIYGLDIEVDGRRVAGAVSSTCAQAQTAADGTRAFTQRKPCPPIATLKADIDTATLADGDRAVRVVAQDAAGNRIVVAQRTITVYNTPPTPLDAQGVARASNPFAQPGHLPNGAGAAEGIKPVLRILTRKGPRTSTLGPRRTVQLTGSLTTPAGQPIVGARLAVVSKVSGRQPEQLDGYHVTDANGYMSFSLPPGPTRTVRLAYYAFSDSRTFTQSAAVTALARTALTLRVGPRRVRAGQLVTLTGGVSREGLPQRGVIAVLQGYQAGLGWRTFRTVRISGTSGRYSTRYRIRYSSNRLKFRVVVRNQEGYPYATTVSRSYAVSVR